MKTKQSTISIGILLISFLFSSCQPSVTAAATATIVPPTETIVSIKTPQPTPEPTETITPSPVLSSWNEIPIFPDAITGKEEMGDYQFTSKSPARIIRAYYEQEMIKMGWKIRTDMVSPGGPDFCFSKGNTYAFFLIQPEANHFIVYIHSVQGEGN
jgi:hypothetical protein